MNKQQASRILNKIAIAVVNGVNSHQKQANRILEKIAVSVVNIAIESGDYYTPISSADINTILGDYAEKIGLNPEEADVFIYEMNAFVNNSFQNSREIDEARLEAEKGDY